MTPAEIVRRAIPTADDALCEHIVWGRTPFPCGAITARDLFYAALRWQRAMRSGRRLCEMCDRLAMRNDWLCRPCDEALQRARRD